MEIFFPQTYQKLEPQPEPTLNERRQTSKFDFRMNLNDPNTEINILFTSTTPSYTDKTTMFEFANGVDSKKKNFTDFEKKLALKCKQESYLELSIPWLTKQYGYKSTISGVFNSVQSCTNLSFKEFIIADKLKLDVDINYPLVWNDLQKWNINVELYKSSVFIVLYHKNFIQDLINDWSSRYMGDLRTFAPYIYDIKVKTNDIEVILPCNQHNWIDTNVIENNGNQ